MTKRHIKPHKGGRTERLPSARVTPETLELLLAVLDGQSFGDWIETQILHAHAELIHARKHPEAVSGADRFRDKEEIAYY
jgi:hypothetical protein